MLTRNIFVDVYRFAINIVISTLFLVGVAFSSSKEEPHYDAFAKKSSAQPHIVSPEHVFDHDDLRGRKFELQEGFHVRFIKVICDSTTSFANSKFQCCDFRNNDLRDVSFDGGDFMGSDFRNCCLKNASFRGARVRGADFSGADLSNIKSDSNTEWSYSKGTSFLPSQIQQIPRYLPAYWLSKSGRMDCILVKSYLASLSQLSGLIFQEDRFALLTSYFKEDFDYWRQFQIPLGSSSLFSGELAFGTMIKSEKSHMHALDGLRKLGVENKRAQLIGTICQAVGYGNMILKFSITGSATDTQVYFQDNFGLSEVIEHKKIIETHEVETKKQAPLEKIAEKLDKHSNVIVGIECSPEKNLTFESYFILFDYKKVNLSNLKDILNLFSINDEQPLLLFLEILKKAGGPMCLSFDTLNINRGVNIQIEVNILKLERDIISRLNNMLNNKGKVILEWVLANQEKYNVVGNHIGMRLNQNNPPKIAWYTQF